MRSKRNDTAGTTLKSTLGVMLRPNQRKALGRTIAYHQQMADFCKDDDPKLSETHAEAAKQLQELVDAAPVMTAIDIAMAKRPVRRALH